MVPSRAVRRFIVAAVFSTLAAALVLLDATQAQTAKGKKYALLVGVRDYESAKLNPLKYTENDAEELAVLLEKRAGFTVRVLTTSRGEKRKADAPTAANLRVEIKKLLARKRRDDTVLVALAGHGIQDRVKEAGKERDENFFCPSDAQFNDSDTLVSLSQLFKDLDNCGAGVKLLLVDACRDDPKLGRNADIDTLPKLPQGTAALFSCKSGERAFETPKLGKGHGVFFYHVLEGLKGEAKNRRGEVTWSSLVDHVVDRVSEEVPTLIGGGAKQTPQLKVNLTGRSPILVGPETATVVKAWPKEIESSIGMKLVRIPAGTFRMGSSKEEQDAAIADYEKILGRKPSDTILAWCRSEGPQHEVEISKDFWLGVHEVTQEQFQKVMDYNPSYFSWDGEGKSGLEYKYSKPAGGKDQVPAAARNTNSFPVENVSHEEAEEFCKKLTAKEAKNGRLYRLPTEAEWEYSCRGGAASSTPFHYGNSLSSTQANFNGNYPYGGADKGDYLARTSKVGSYKPNRFGLYDMHGNVWEWCADWAGSDYYGKSPRRDPPGPLEGSLRVFRGGGWGDAGRNCRSAGRDGDTPASRHGGLGFRVALVPTR